MISQPLWYVLWCCGIVCHEVFFFRFFRDAAIRNNYLCINPYHYGYETPAAQNSSTEHSCLKNARIQATGSTLKTICKICRYVLTEEDMTDGFFNYQKPAIPERSMIIIYFIVLAYILHLHYFYALTFR